MSIVADFGVPAVAFCLGDTLAAVPEATVELEGVVAHSPEHVMPFVMVHGTDEEPFTSALAEDATVEQASVTDSFEDSHLVHITWTDLVEERLHRILDHEGVVLQAQGAGDAWRLLVRFDTRDAFATFQDHFEEYGAITLHRISDARTPGGRQYGVSDKQRETLLAAYDAGYYDIPSSITGAGLARQLGVSQQAVSRRLRRGVRALIEHTLDRRRMG